MMECIKCECGYDQVISINSDSVVCEGCKRVIYLDSPSPLYFSGDSRPKDEKIEEKGSQNEL